MIIILLSIVRFVLEFTVPIEAVTTTEPTVIPVASPCKPAELFILATDEFEDDHVTWSVMFFVDESVYVPVAEY